MTYLFSLFRYVLSLLSHPENERTNKPALVPSDNSHVWVKNMILREQEESLREEIKKCGV